MFAIYSEGFGWFHQCERFNENKNLAAIYRSEKAARAKINKTIKVFRALIEQCKKISMNTEYLEVMLKSWEIAEIVEISKG